MCEYAKAFSEMEFKWESVKLCKLIQCSFLLKSLILLLEQLNISVDIVAVFDVLVSYCICFEKPWNPPPPSLKIMCWVFYLRIPAFHKHTEYEKAQDDEYYNGKSDIKYIFCLKIQNFHMLSISKWYISYLLQKHWCHCYCIVFKDE